MDLRPINCRFRLQDEGKSYPRSRCTACGRGIASGLGKECADHSKQFTDALIEDVERMQWQPMTTAPKDGKSFLIGWPGYVTEMAMWDCGTNQFVRSVWQRHPTDPTGEHTSDPLDIENAKWMALPEPPSVEIIAKHETEV